MVTIPNNLEGRNPAIVIGWLAALIVGAVFNLVVTAAMAVGASSAQSWMCSSCKAPEPTAEILEEESRASRQLLMASSRRSLASRRRLTASSRRTDESMQRAKSWSVSESMVANLVSEVAEGEHPHDLGSEMNLVMVSEHFLVNDHQLSERSTRSASARSLKLSDKNAMAHCTVLRSLLEREVDLEADDADAAVVKALAARLETEYADVAEAVALAARARAQLAQSSKPGDEAPEEGRAMAAAAAIENGPQLKLPTWHEVTAFWALIATIGACILAFSHPGSGFGLFIFQLGASIVCHNFATVHRLEVICSHSTQLSYPPNTLHYPAKAAPSSNSDQLSNPLRATKSKLCIVCVLQALGWLPGPFLQLLQPAILSPALLILVAGFSWPIGGFLHGTSSYKMRFDAGSGGIYGSGLAGWGPGQVIAINLTPASACRRRPDEPTREHACTDVPSRLVPRITNERGRSCGPSPNLRACKSWMQT